MTASSSPGQRGLDAAPIVYRLLSGHPASAMCEGLHPKPFGVAHNDRHVAGSRCRPAKGVWRVSGVGRSKDRTIRRRSHQRCCRRRDLGRLRHDDRQLAGNQSGRRRSHGDLPGTRAVDHRH